MSQQTAAITSETVDAIADQFAQTDLGPLAFDAVRSQFPSVRITHCFDDDIFSGKPVARRPKFAIYLVGGDEHCLSLTNDFDIAIGVVIAELLDDK
ncbi:hypothetical protein LOC68_10380 [Blastopirellula sp. JC732]|uniref:Uncharacterized protein n=1 Tax=Blastopirellula sediminis TaxID=2894196 RepID=A0A9X1MM62_9BACT|nr:hypothetical protein [Blastopirellula sediminis]MCC9608418.1 hypothetical protein [Blastopirellula sediminis]MCC9628805.1 hypothetical protein [Blastopirellula sediminis]